jgi:16S rRNA (guanine527-N7)-methyltransferase
MDQALLETLRTAQRFGFFGDRPIEQAAEHSMAFVRALEQITVPVRSIDLGSGGGLPGLVIAHARPEWSVVLLDRRQKRTDFLQLAVTKLGLSGVEVCCDDVASVVEAVDSGAIAPFDVVTARGFGPPEVTLRTGIALLAPGGRVVISEPPAGDRWPPELLAELGLCSDRRGSVRVFQRCDEQLC